MIQLRGLEAGNRFLSTFSSGGIAVSKESHILFASVSSENRHNYSNDSPTSNLWFIEAVVELLL